MQEQERIAERPKRFYGALDGAKVHIRGEKDAQKGPWKNLEVGAWFTTTAKPPQSPDEDWKIEAQKMSCYCDTLPSQQFEELLLGNRLSTSSSIG